MPLPREQNHMWEMPDTLLQARHARKGEDGHAILGSANAFAPSGLAMHHAIDGFKSPEKAKVKMRPSSNVQTDDT